MPTMPQQAVKLDDGIYNFQVKTVQTIPEQTRNGQHFGPQEQMTLAVCDDDWQATDQTTRGWVSHSSYKTIMSLIEAGICKVVLDENGEPEEWNIRPGARFVGHVIDGKIKSYKKPPRIAQQAQEE